MHWLENKYIGLMSYRLDKFRRRNNAYNFRCPVCGDSSKDKNKARGWIYEKQGRVWFYCHNCSAGMTLKNFIKTVDQSLYSQYMMEKLKEEGGENKIDEFFEKVKKPQFMREGILKGLRKVSQLPPDHYIKKYVVERMIPNPFHAKMFECRNFFAHVNDFVPNKFSEESLKHDESRLLIPFINKDKKVHAIQGRSFNPKSKTKYITIVLDESVEKIYGLDTVNLDKTTYVMEGPIDSMFIPNSIATAGGDLVSALNPLHASKTSMVVVYDNEPRSKETVKKIEKAIMQGYRVCIWPENIAHKDINDMIKAGLSADFIKYIIDQNTHKDLSAMLALKKWSKV